MVQMRYPGFLKKAVTLSYDDGNIYDVKLFEIMAKYGLKGTFNLNSEMAATGRRMSWAQMEKLYSDSDNEIAVHGAQHLNLAEIDDGRAMRDLIADREKLEAHFGRIVRGMAYANGSADEHTADLISKAGLVYGRTTNDTFDFDLPKNWLLWGATCHHTTDKLWKLCDEFLALNLDEGYFGSLRPKLFYLWGHSYEFNDNNNWGIIEKFGSHMGGRSDIWYATNYEIWQTADTYKSLIFSANGYIVENPSCHDAYICVDRKNVLVPAGKTIKIG